MGCVSSKVDDLPAVALCRDRVTFLDEAIRQRFALAEAHLAYTQSLTSVSSSLKRFLDPTGVVISSTPAIDSNPQKISEPSGSTPVVTRDSLSISGSHLHFQSDSDDDGCSSGSLHHSGHSSPLNTPGHRDYPTPEILSSYNDGVRIAGFTNMNFMKSQATPSVIYQQRPIVAETGYVGDAGYYQNSSSFPYSLYGYPNYGTDVNGYLPSQSQPSFTSYPHVERQPSSSSSSKPLPPPPSPPKSSSWDFFNFFDMGNGNYPSYTSSRNSKEVREEEGIPDLEEVDYQQEVVKEVHGDEKFVGSGGSGSSSSSARYSHSVHGNDGNTNKGKAFYQTRKSVSVEDEVEYEVHMVEKKVVDSENAKERENAGSLKSRARPQGISEVLREIFLQFEIASGAGNELAKLLEVGKLPYRRNHVSSMLHMISPSLSVSSSQKRPKNAESLSDEKVGSSPNDFDLETKSTNLSSSLQKCYLWEKKLFDEVKAEEKLRVTHDKKCKRLKRLDERGAEDNKVDSTRVLIRSLSTKIRISIQVVDKISVKINKLRDEELWPQINELIHGLSRMWKLMVECQKSQCGAIKATNDLDTISRRQKAGSTHLEDAMNLEHELINWTLWFSSWIHAQKAFVRALNNWLMKCLLYVPEETADGVAPFSPGSMGAPPLFVTAHQWCLTMDRVSEKEVIEAMRIFSASVLHIWEEGMSEGHDTEGKRMEREDRKVRKEIEGLDRKLDVLLGDEMGRTVSRDFTFRNEMSGVQASLENVFFAMERLCVKFDEAYGELLQRVDEEAARSSA